MSEVAGQRERTAEVVVLEALRSGLRGPMQCSEPEIAQRIVHALGLLRDSGSGDPLTQRVRKIETAAHLLVNALPYDCSACMSPEQSDLVDALRAALSDRERDTTRNEDG